MGGIIRGREPLIVTKTDNKSMKQKVYFNDNKKLIVKTDNGTMEQDGNTKTSLWGSFEIESKDVATLLTILSGIDCKYYYGNGWMTKKEGLIELIDQLDNTATQYSEKIDELEKEIKELKSKLNSSWWYRLWHH